MRLWPKLAADDAVEHEDWLRLDNAAKIYPSSYSPSSPPVFRLSVRLAAPVRVSALTQALARVMRRCPYFQVYLRRGFFWYYLQRHNEIPPLEPLGDSPISVIPIRGRNTHLLRVQARQRTIAVDFSHVLTDGGGGLRFLGTLVTEYLRLCGVAVASTAPFLDPAESPGAEEAEDAHNRFFKGHIPKPRPLSRVYQIEGDNGPDGGYRVIEARMPVAQVLNLTRSLGVSLTEYLAALYIHCLTEMRRAQGGRSPSVVRLEVPVNMRRFHPSGTMRNFSLYVSPEVDTALGDYSFDEVLARVHHTMQLEIEARELDRQIRRNVAAERNPLVRGAPLPVKDFVLSLANRRLGQRAYSGVLSNLGAVTVPPELDAHVQAFGFALAPNAAIKTSCAVLSFRESLHLAFGSVVASPELERLFLTALARRGVGVTVGEGRS
jgi:hypothetical protein